MFGQPNIFCTEQNFCFRYNQLQSGHIYNLYLETIQLKHNIVISSDININIASKHFEQSYERRNRHNYLTFLTMHSILPGHSFPTREQQCLDHFMLKANVRRISVFIAVLNTSTDRQKQNCQKTKMIVNFDSAYESLQKHNLNESLTQIRTY